MVYYNFCWTPAARTIRLIGFDNTVITKVIAEISWISLKVGPMAQQAQAVRQLYGLLKSWQFSKII